MISRRFAFLALAVMMRSASPATSCACQMQMENIRSAISDVSSLPVGEQKTTTLSLSDISLERNPTQRIGVALQAHEGWVSIFLFLLAQIICLSAGVVFATRILKIPRTELVAMGNVPILASSLLMGVIPLVGVAVFQRPELGLPGIFIGMVLASFDVIPFPRYSWMPVAWLVNSALYYLIGRIAQFIGRRMRHPTATTRAPR
jgi:hypothetical protein